MMLSLRLMLDMILGDGIGGLETYRKMIKINPSQKAVIVSGYSTSEDVRKTLELGACSITKKPYTIKELSMAIKDCLEKG